MRTNQSKLSYGLVAACFIVGLAVGCGDDTDGGGAGAGGAAGSAGAAGTAGSAGGGAGRGGSGGGGASGTAAIAECVAATSTATANANPACGMCVCTQDAKAGLACAKAADCWKLISCIATNCPGSTLCATMTGGACVPFVAGGAATAMPVGTIIRGACSSVCVTSSGDGGAADAGI